MVAREMKRAGVRGKCNELIGKPSQRYTETERTRHTSIVFHSFSSSLFSSKTLSMKTEL